MRLLLLLFFTLLAVGGNAVYGQSMPVDTAGFQTFTHQSGDTTYLMKQYFMCFLKVGPRRDQDEATAAKIQEGHLAHLAALGEQRKICLAGPFADDSGIQGVVIYSTPTYEEAASLANQDPAVLAGRLVVEIHPFWAAVGAQLF
ncbi:YciI family protein [Lewinella cohaerens]|uniref:YciI family protein n=1 Tax=Lewinella cohaerens TaxID=70995 RepID=UPI00036A38B6|nr:YciI family protein [Lewinella cohaerens]